MKKFLKILKITGISIVSFLVILIIGMNIYFKAPVFKYYKNSKKAFIIPGLSNDFIAQGITYDKSTDNFYLTGYMNDGSASPIYIVNKSSRKLIKAVKLQNQNGTDFTGHAGGLSLLNENIYVAGSTDCCLYVFSKKDIDTAAKNSFVKCTGIVDLTTDSDALGVAFTTTHENLIYAGEFHRLPNYPTLPNHTVQTDDGEQYALTVGFELEENFPIPKVAYSIPDLVQGICFSEDAIFLTTSWGPAFSHVYKYNYSDITQSGTKEVCGQEVPLYCLTTSNASQVFKTAPMAEEIEYVDGRYYISNESASNKYIFGKFTGGKWCLATTF